MRDVGRSRGTSCTSNVSEPGDSQEHELACWVEILSAMPAPMSGIVVADVDAETPTGASSQKRRVGPYTTSVTSTWSPGFRKREQRQRRRGQAGRHGERRMAAFELRHRRLEVGDRGQRRAGRRSGPDACCAAASLRSATVSNRIVDARNTGVFTAPSHLRGARPSWPTSVDGLRVLACRSQREGSPNEVDLRGDRLPDVDDQRVGRALPASRTATAAAIGGMYLCWRAASRAAIVASSPSRYTMRTSPARCRRCAIRLLERRAREHRVLALRKDLPRSSSAMRSSHGQRSSSVSGTPRAIFATLAGGWKSSASRKRPADGLRERLADRRLAATAHAHQDQDHALAIRRTEARMVTRSGRTPVRP